jgi:hypothetical protein
MAGAARGAADVERGAVGVEAAAGAKIDFIEDASALFRSVWPCASNLKVAAGATAAQAEESNACPRPSPMAVVTCSNRLPLGYWERLSRCSEATILGARSACPL